MSRGALGDDASATSPARAYFDPDEIDGSTFTMTQETNGFSFIRTIRAPLVALAEDAPYVLVLRTASQMPGIPGDTVDVDGFCARPFTAGEVLADTQIVEIKKAGSTPGQWEIWP